MASYKLGKGEEYNLAKDNGEELSHIKAYLHWVAGPHSDLDASAFLLGKDGTVINHDGFVYYNATNRAALPDDDSKGEDYYFTHLYNAESTPFDREKFGTKKNWKDSTRPMSADGSVLGSFDNKGDEEDESGEWLEADETLNINLDKVDPKVYEIVVCITIHPDPEYPDISFKDIREPYVEIIDDDTDEVLCRYEMNDAFKSETAAEVGKLFVNDDGEWKFRAIGKGYDGGLQTLVDIYTD